MTSITIKPDNRTGFTLRELSGVVHHIAGSGFDIDTTVIRATVGMRGQVTSITAKTPNDPAPPHVKLTKEPTLWVVAADREAAVKACEKRGLKPGSRGKVRNNIRIRTTERSLHGSVIRPGDSLLMVDPADELVKAFEFVLSSSRLGYADLVVMA